MMAVSFAVGYDAGKKLKGRKRFLTVDTLDSSSYRCQADAG
jgi:hypothetical protein